MNRRQFLKGTALAALLAPLLPRQVLAPPAEVVPVQACLPAPQRCVLKNAFYRGIPNPETTLIYEGDPGTIDALIPVLLRNYAVLEWVSESRLSQEPAPPGSAGGVGACYMLRQYRYFRVELRGIYAVQLGPVIPGETNIRHTFSAGPVVWGLSSDQPFGILEHA